MKEQHEPGRAGHFRVPYQRPCSTMQQSVLKQMTWLNAAKSGECTHIKHIAGTEDTVDFAGNTSNL